ncbi:hypothetical protein BST81_19570 [Leptolyngbya sp. 'hensonii']|uniref:DUF4255 domain-containing protein n=1 Tax=Leptolyngbya sp. 'hensonii' TaxID=1922337 RepID=UPI00094FFDA9|nr:DUF4255 domain-containing protein [Leptolyngbya sp. 'hensonii']OLP16639.1 hypothetical protein BST81_19570 [Leptolyngbya sp. 'hensonii']
MSNHLAVAAVTATLQRILQSAIQDDVYGARVTTMRPNMLESGLTEPGVNIYLYLVTPNPAYRSNDPIGRRPRGELVKRTQAAVDLQFLLSFHGNENELEPQRLLGSVVGKLQDVLTITPDMIRDTLNDPAMAYLAESDLADQMEPIRIVATEISVENLSKIWSVFFQTPYSLSATYKATVVLLEGEEPGQLALPVRERRPLVMPFQQLAIERVMAQAGPLQPILANTTLLILGRNLHSNLTLIRIGNLELEPEQVSDHRIVFSLASVPQGALHPGVQSLQVVHPGARQQVPGPYRGIESNLAPFVLRPTITEVTATDSRRDGPGTYAALVTITFNLPIRADQIVVLVLNEWSTDNPSASLFKATRRNADGLTVTIPVDRLKAGDYLVRVQVDGAESLLDYDTNPGSPTFNRYISPRVVIGG